MVSIHSVLVTGANRGIGLEFVKQFLTNPAVTCQVVIAACRTPEQASDLKQLQQFHTNLHLIKLDVTQFGNFETVADEVRRLLDDEGLTLLVNNAGVFTTMHDLESLNGEEFMSILATNTAAPLLLTKVFYPLLKKSAQALHDDGLSVQRAAVINISSCAGSIALSGRDKYRPAFGYRESKAALGTSTQTLAKLLRQDGILVEAVHPGTVVTDMAGAKGSIDTRTSVTGMLDVILRLSEKNTNGFYDWKGDVLPF
nr:PREDICTED: uncharacterized oxidoreductase C663.08c-like isoform X1 [Bemisia tabaci]XP_018907606.1 PREDICTED: uncharacterized oxidoreductase C663.08c-like isoform X1 [Bemisia tabaci]